MPLTPKEAETYHLEQAKAYANPLQAELGPDDEDQLVSVLQDQGVAMRCVLYHCTAALIAALDRRR